MIWVLGICHLAACLSLGIFVYKYTYTLGGLKSAVLALHKMEVLKMNIDRLQSSKHIDTEVESLVNYATSVLRSVDPNFEKEIGNE
jgi:hypothetical protein